MKKALAVLVLFYASTAMAADRWMHLRVVDHGADGGTVNLTLPLSAVRNSIPSMIDLDDDSNLSVNGHDVTASQLRALVAAARDGKEVVVTSEGDTVRVTRSGADLLVRTEDGSERVEIRMPLWLADAMLSGGGERLNLRAGIDAIVARGEGALTIQSDDETSVRIWVDGRSE